MSPEPTEEKATLGKKMAAELNREAVSTRKMLERIPFEEINWKPHEKSSEIGNLSEHIARLPSFVKHIITADQFDLASSRKHPAINSNDELTETFDGFLAEASEYLNTVSDEDLMVNWKLKSGEHTLFDMARVAVIRSLVFGHLIHHRGQLSVYLRLKNIPVPSIYGPSADEQQ